MGFVDAVRDLAQQAGLTVPEMAGAPGEREEAARLKQKQLTLSDVLARAAEGYRRQLKTSARAIAYLKGRGLSGEIAARFGLGYATDSWRGLASVFASYDDPLLEESGLVVVHSDEARPGDDVDAPAGKRYDRFRDRIMIETINKMNRLSRQHLQEFGFEPDAPTLAEKMEIPEDKIRKIMKIAKEPISMETPIGDDEDSHLGDFIEDTSVASPRPPKLKSAS